MSDSTLLAAVHAAVNGEQAEGEGAKPVTLTADLIKTHAPAVAGQLAAEGAAAERTRIEGIRGAAMKGQEKLANELIADGKTTPGDAALRFIDAHKASLASQARAIEDNEALVATVKPAPITVDTKVSKAATPEEWKAEWATSEKLQSEFTSADLYAAHMKFETRMKGAA